MDEYNEQNSPFVNRPGTEPPGYRPSYTRVYRDLGNNLVRASNVLGVLALILLFTFTVYPAMVLGSLAIILALLSKGKEKKMHARAKTGVILGTIALIVNTVLVGGGVYLITSVPEYREQFNQIYESIYGESFDDMMNDIKNGQDPFERLPGDM